MLRPISIAICAAVAALAAVEPLAIANPLKLDWPWELVEIERPADEAAGIGQATGMGDPRPVQVESAGPGRVRLAFIATLPKTGGKPAERFDIGFAAGPATGGIVARREADGGWSVDNGVAEVRLAGPRAWDPPVPLAEAAHWLGGIAIGAARDGGGRFIGDARIAALRVEPLRQGPVVHEYRFTWIAADPGEDGSVQAPELATGKRSHRFPPDQIPTVATAKRQRDLAAQVRIVHGDPWIAVHERWRLPAGCGQIIAAGGPDGLPIREALWTRWFEYDRFGGNAQQKAAPLTPRPEQRGRPFAVLVPRWHQGGGGAQEAVAAGLGDDAPAIGAAAVHPTAWVGPMANGIRVEVEGGDRFRLEAPFADPEVAWYGMRAWGLILGRRGMVAGTGTINGLVRRHADWTLQAQIERYVLAWERDPAAVSPTILIGREQLARLRADLAADRRTAETDLVRAARAQGAAGGKLPREDEVLLAVLAGRKPPGAGMPSPGTYLSARYQDDFVNPTAVGNRRQFAEPFLLADLANAGSPFGTAGTAAIAYIATDLDAWPGWHNGFHPGNPNFHTDKYIAAVYAAATLADHPHAPAFAAFARSALAADIARTLREPDGVGYECPGYAGYALGLQLKAARALANAGHGDLIAGEPRMRATGRWHRLLLTPYDRRLGHRHEAPIGDTHRWKAGAPFRRLASFYAAADPAFAGEMEAAHRLVHGDEPPEGLVEGLSAWDPSIVAADPAGLDWGSRAFAGFGAVLRSRFGTPDETFLSFKAGISRGHYHNDELSVHFYGGGAPLALDYNCSYHPRGDHAALHNGLTFGRSGTVRHNARDADVAAMEQLGGPAAVIGAGFRPEADAVAAERGGDRLLLSPWDPEDAEFSRAYPVRRTGRIVHRRIVALVKHPPGAQLADWLAVRDETAGGEPAQLNWHLLVRRAEAIAPGRWRCPGQGERDLLLAVDGAGEPELRRWQYLADNRPPPAELLPRPDEDDAAWGARVRGIAAPATPSGKSGEHAAAWTAAIAASDGRALMPPPGWTGTWTYGECQRWLRFPIAAGGAAISVLYPLRPGAPPPAIAIAGDRIRIELGGEAEELRLSSAAGAVLARGGAETAILAPLPPIGAAPAAARDRFAADPIGETP